MRFLEVVQIVIVLRKFNDFEGSALILSLPWNPLFGSFGRSQKPFKRSPKSISEGYQIRLIFAKAFKIASKTDFDSKMTSQSPSKRLPKRHQNLPETPKAPPDLRFCLISRLILQLLQKKTVFSLISMNSCQSLALLQLAGTPWLLLAHHFDHVR